MKISDSCSKKLAKEPFNLRREIWKYLTRFQHPFLFGVAVFGLTSVVGYRFYNQPKLSPGTQAPETIIAPQNGKFEDQKKTEEKRQEARAAIHPILQRNLEKTEKIKQSLQTLFERIDGLRQTAGLMPFLPGSLLPSNTQHYLLSCSDEQWEQILKTIKDVKTTPNKIAQRSQSTPQYKAIIELHKYQKKVSEADFKNLINKITQLRQQYFQTIASLAQESSSVISLEATESLLKSNKYTWNKTKNGIQNNLEQILTQGLSEGITQEHLQEIINIQLNDNLVPQETKWVAQEILFNLLKNQANLEINKDATATQVEQAANAIDPFYVEIKKGEVIVEKGSIISPEDFVLLDEFKLSRRGIDWQGLGKSGILVTGTVFVFWGFQKKLHCHLRRRDYLLLCLISLTTPLLAIFKIPYTNLPAVGLLTSSFYGSPLAVTQVILLTGLTAFTTENLSATLLAGAAGGLLGAVMADKLRSRDELAILGGGVGLIQAGIYCISFLVISSAAKIIWLALLPDVITYGLSGVAWSVIALGISPYLERLFDVATPIRLIELSNPNSVLLKRLATETPGTFQHTLLVACLAEAAARKLHCNVELVRAGTLYHDIGKMHDPLGFIENQMGGPNKHDLINDPYQSVEIIKKHVTEGLVMARKYGLPRVIQNFIPEHQGTLLIAYFYYQAKQQAEENGQEVCEANFRYAGPIPQCRETAIVMLADGCEAALRSLRDATPDAALGTIKKIFQARWRDNQLKDSGIRYEELKTIAEIFVQVWQQFHHQRIAYPKAALEPKSSFN
jgi:putative nucleotidyltransferase with HDIG domain